MSCGSDRGFKEFPQTCNIKECAAGTKFDENNENCIEESSENDVVEFSTEPSCPECWQLNTAKTACVIIPNSGCCEMSCDAAKMTFSFLPKMMDQDDLSHDFGVTGLTGNTGSGKYQYSHGFGTTGQDRV